MPGATLPSVTTGSRGGQGRSSGTRAVVGLRAPVGLELALLDAEKVIVFTLPASGKVTIGRAEDSDVRIDDVSVSRRHAVLHVGAGLRIEDVGSANGTSVRHGSASNGVVETLEMKRLAAGETAEVRVGDCLTLGSKLLVVRGAIEDTHAAPAGPAQAGGNATGPVVTDPAMRALYQVAQQIAASPISVLILGETGAGKELLAEALHRFSPRAAQPFLRLHCASLSESLLESELFGHEKGAFTGAVRAKPGLLETAHGGTIFLDEVGELPLAFQVKLLRVLEDRKVLRVGAVTPRAIDVRVVAATNRDLEAAVKAGTFRADLFFRLNGMSLTIPPLRERKSEIAPLAERFAWLAGRQLGRTVPPRLSPAVLARLERYHFPGNIRELRNVIERAVALCSKDTIGEDNLPRALLDGTAPAVALPPPVSERTAELDPPPRAELRKAIEAVERQRIVDALDKCAGNQTHAARLLGISRRTLVNRLGDYDLPRPRQKR
jgi:two-component system response regulator AtoC